MLLSRPNILASFKQESTSGGWEIHLIQGDQAFTPSQSAPHPLTDGGDIFLPLDEFQCHPKTRV